MYDGSHMLAQNGLVGSRVVQQGMLASQVDDSADVVLIMYGVSTLQYLQTPTHQMSGYQVKPL